MGSGYCLQKDIGIDSKQEKKLGKNHREKTALYSSIKKFLNDLFPFFDPNYKSSITHTLNKKSFITVLLSMCLVFLFYLHSTLENGAHINSVRVNPCTDLVFKNNE